LTPKHLEDFYRDGVIVIENILTTEEVNIARNGLHSQLLPYGINHNEILDGRKKLDPIFGARLKSPAAEFFYAKWKLLDIQLNQNVYQSFNELLTKTYFTGTTNGFVHSMGKSDSMLAYIDRVCWRLPDHIRSEGGLDLHLDRNPIDPYLLRSKNGCLTKWRPIQAFVTLTDQYGGESGGLRVIKGFHHKIDEYFNDRVDSSDLGTGGEFYRMGGKSHVSLQKECQPIDAPAGSLVCWDNRLPHATCQKLTSHDSREVVYLSYLPNIELNKQYARKQWLAIKNNRIPPAYCTDINIAADRDWDLNNLTEIQKTLLGEKCHP
jgi:hypothetical protein